MKDIDQNDPKGSNGSSPDSNVAVEFDKAAEIDGFQVRYGEDDEGGIVIESPSDLPADRSESFERKATEFVNTLGSAKKKNLDLNLERQKLEQEKRQLEQDRAALEAQKNAQAQAPATPVHKEAELIKRHFGVSTWDEVEDLRAENPGKFYQAQAAMNAEIAANQAASVSRTETIRAQIRGEGYNAQEIEAFATASGISNLNVAFDYYKRINQPPPGKPLSQFQKERSVRIVPPSKGVGNGGSGAKKTQSLREAEATDND